MDAALTHLERILDRLSNPEKLQSDEVGFLAREWDTAVARLQTLVARGPKSPARQRLRPRLAQVIQRMSEVEEKLTRHKSAVARQLFSENRRFQALRRGYKSGGSTPPPSRLMNHQA